MPTNFTQTSSPLVDKAGMITPPWAIIFERLWKLASGDKMSASQALFPPAALTNTPASLYTNANLQTRIDKATATNTTGAPITVSVYLSPAGGTPDGTTVVANAVSVAANTSLDLTTVGGHVLGKNWQYYASASATGVTFISSGSQLPI